jgi:hypothetical protein
VTETEIAFRAAINVLRDSVDSRRMPSGERLEPDAVEVHAQAADHLERLLLRHTGGELRP